MKKLIMLFLFVTICLSSVSASAISKGMANILKEEGLNGLYYDDDLGSWTCFINGDMSKNCWGSETARGYKRTYYFGNDFKAVKGWLTLGDNTYYLSKYTSIMAIGKQKVDGVYYTFADDGHLIN